MDFRQMTEEFWKEFHERQVRRFWIMIIQVIGVLVILGVQLTCNLMEWTVYPWNMLWVVVIIVWGIAFILWQRHESNRPWKYQQRGNNDS
jgi:protein-S-isoprenylcysteine O-methyltransferase Ste14